MSLRSILRRACAGLVLLFAGLGVSHADRPYAVRYTANVNGSFALVGNSQMTCAASADCTSAQNRAANPTGLHNQSFAMVQVSVDAATVNSSSASLNLPAGSTVLWAGLYWGARSASAARGQVLFRTPTAFGYSLLSSSVVDTAAGGEADNYAAFVDVTALVQAGGNGTYTVANMALTTGAAGGTSEWGGWGLLVAYQNNALSLKNLTAYDGFRLVTGTPGVTLNVSGFLTPATGPVQTLLGTIGYDGDLGLTGDNFVLNGSTVTDANNPPNDFYNSTIADRGVPILARSPAHLNTFGTDVDTYTAPNGAVGNSASSAVLQLSTGGEFYYPHMIFFQTELHVPVITPNLVKTVTDLNGGDLLPGDILRWTISMNNTGFDTATNLVMVDNIPANTTYVPGSLNILTGAGAGGKSDTVDADQADYRIAGGPNRVVFRLGSGAGIGDGGNDFANGGSLAFGQSTSISFDTLLNASVPAGTVITNSVSISYSGQTLSTTTFTGATVTGTAVLAPPAIAKTFLPNPIAAGGVSVLRITVSNPPGNLSNLNGVAFTDTYPAGLLNSATPGAAVVCSAGSTPGALSGGAPAGNSIAMTGAILAPGGSCEVTVNVTAAAGGLYANTTGPVSSTNGGTGGTASATLSVGKLGVVKSFAAPSIEAGTGPANLSTLTFTVSNPNPLAAIGLTFSDSYPANLVNAAPLTVGGTCAGVTHTAAAGGGSFNVTGGIVPANGTCTITVQVRGVAGTTSGLFANQASGAAYTGDAVPGLPSNTAVLTIVGAPSAVKTFTPAFVNTGDVSTLRIVVTNPNTTTTLSRAGVVFTDTYPAGLFNTTPAMVTLNCTPGSTGQVAAGTGAAGGNTLGLQNATLAPGGSCTLTSNVTSAALGTYNNPPAATAFIFDDAPDPVMQQPPGGGQLPGATLTVTGLVEPTWTKVYRNSANTANITALAFGSSAIVRIDITNPNGGPVNGVAFTDTYPAGLANTGSPAPAITAVAGTCTGVAPIVTAAAGGNQLAVSGLNLSAGAVCRVEVNVTATTNGTYFNNTGPLTSAGTPPQNTPATATLDVLRPPLIVKSFSPNSIGPLGTAVLTIAVSNAPGNNASLTGVTFTDVFPASPGAMTLANATTTTTSNFAAPACGTLQDSAGGALGAGDNGVRIDPAAAATLRPGETCTYTFNVTAAAAGAYSNTTNGIASAGPVALAGIDATAALTVGGLGIAKAFAPATANVGDIVTLTFTLANNTGAARTGLAFTDTFPVGLQLASAAVGGTCTGVVSNAAAGAASFAVTAGNVPLAGCTVTVQVTSTSFGSFNNQTSGASCSGCGVTSPPSNVATLLVNPPPSVSKSFLTPVVGANQVSRLRIRIFNVNSFALSGLAFTDLYPAGLVNAPAPAPSTTCDNPATGGVTPAVTAVAGANSVSLATGELVANSACDVEVNVTAATAGGYVNDIPAAAVSSSAGANLSPTSATLIVLAPLQVVKTFIPSAIGVGGLATLRVRLTNPNAVAVSLAAPAFTDAYPAQIVNAAAPSKSTTCPGATVTAVAGASQLALSGGTVPANNACDVLVTVTSASAGVWTNPAFVVTTTNAGTATAPAVPLSVGRLSIGKIFSPNPIAAGGTSTLSFTITNPSGAAVTLGSPAFVDVFPIAPGAMVVAAPLVTANTCGGMLVDSGNALLAAGDVGIRLNGGSVPANGSCTLSVSVLATAGGTYNNVTTAVADNAGNTGNTASASLTVMAPPTAVKSFNPTVVGIGQPSVLSIRLNNPNAFPINGVAFTDNYPASLVNAASPAAASTCGGSVTASPGGAAITLTGGTIAANSFCTITVNVAGTANGVLANDLPAGTVSTANAGSNTAASNSATLTVLLPPAVLKDFPLGTPAGTAPVNTPTQLRIRLTNPAANGAVAITGADFTDSYPGGLVNAAAPAATIAGAGCSGSVTAAPGGASLSVTNLVIPGGGATCTVTVNVAAAASGFYANSTGPVTTTNAGTGAAASGTLYAMAPITGSKTFSVNPLGFVAGAGPNSLLTITLSNPNPYPVTGVVFTDTFPANLVIGNPVNAATTCGAGNLSDPAGAALASAATGIRLGSTTAGTIAANGSCTVTVNVEFDADINATRTNTITGGAAAGNLNTGNAGPGPTIAASITETGGTLAPVLAKAFSPNPVGVNLPSTLTFTLSNPNGATALAGIDFTDAYPSGLVNATPLAVGGSCAATVDAGTVAGGGSFSIVPLGLAGGASCTVTVQVIAAAAGAYANTSGNITSTSAGGLVGNTASAVLTVLDPPAIVKSFAPAAISQGQNTVATFVLTNDNLVPLTGVSFTDALANMTVANPPLSSVSGAGCTGYSVTAPGGSTSISVSGGTLPARVGLTPGTCTITVTLTSGVVGLHPNATSGVASVESPTGVPSNVAYLAVNAVSVPVSGFVYRDANQNGSREATEDWTGGALVYVNLVQGGVVVQSQAVPAGGGAYTFPTVLYGNYELIVTNSPVSVTPGAPGGYFFTGPADGRRPISVTGAAVAAQNFGLAGAGLSALSGRVFLDTGAGGGTANDGVQNGAEPGIAGVSVRLTDCAATTYGTTVTDGGGNYQFFVPAGATTLCVVEANAAGYLSTGASVGAIALPSGAPAAISGTLYTYTRGADVLAFANVAGTSYSGLNFADVPANALTTDNVQAGLAGSIVFHAHSYTAGSAGTVTFSTSASAAPAVAGWGETLFQDTNCNGRFDSGEPQLTAPMPMSAGQGVCLLLRQFIPLGAPGGAQNTVTLTATFSYSGASPALGAVHSRTDVTTVGAPPAAGLTLVKSVAPTGPALPGATLTYTVAYGNNSSQALATIVISDATPAFTTFVSASCGATPPGLICNPPTTPMAGGTGAIEWVFGGTLAPGASGTVLFQVQVQN